MGDGIRLTIVHNNCLFRECLCSVLAESERFQPSGLELNDTAVLEQLSKLLPDIVLTEMRLPLETTTELVQKIRAQIRGVKVIVLVPTKHQEAIVGSVQVGADGCVLDEASIEELKLVINSVSRGESYCSPQIANSMFAQLGKLARESRWSQRAEAKQLTTRELEILRMIAEDGLSNKQIAIKLKLSLYTVKNHVHHILEKLKVDNRFQAVEYAYEQHLL